MSEDIEIVVQVPAPIQIELTTQQGPPGPSQVDKLLASKLAVGPIGGGRVVRYTDDAHVAIASADTLSHLQLLAGISTHAVSAAEESLQVLREGELADGAWTWTPNQPVYLGLNGVLTQTYSSNWAFAIVVGVAISATRILVHFRSPIIQG